MDRQADRQTAKQTQREQERQESRIKSTRIKLRCMSMEEGGVDRTVIDCRQNQLGQMADFPTLVTFFKF